MTHKEKAMKLFKEGYNCSQSVLGAFCDETEIDFDTAMKIASGFGGGMGRLRETCGSVTGMFMVLGLLKGYSDPKATSEKAKLYEDIQKLAQKFKDSNGSITCRELLNLGKKVSDLQPDSPIPEQRTDEYYKKRPCVELVGFAAELLENFIEDKKND